MDKLIATFVNLFCMIKNVAKVEEPVYFTATWELHRNPVFNQTSQGAPRTHRADRRITGSWEEAEDGSTSILTIVINTGQGPPETGVQVIKDR